MAEEEDWASMLGCDGTQLVVSEEEKGLEDTELASVIDEAADNAASGADLQACPSHDSQAVSTRLFCFRSLLFRAGLLCEVLAEQQPATLGGHSACGGGRQAGGTRPSP